MKKFWENYKFSFTLLLGIFVGALIGVVMGEKATALEPIGQIFLNLMFTIVVPMVFVSIASSVGSMLNMKRLGKILGSMVGTFIVTGLFAAAIVLVVVNVLSPAANTNIAMEATEMGEMQSVSDMIVGSLTVDDFTGLLSRKNMLPIIIAAILTGLAVAKCGGEESPFGKLLANMNQVIMKLIEMIMKFAPIGLGAYFANLVGEFGPQLIGDYAAYKVRGYSEEMLLRATALSYLVCMYIKEYSGKLSAFCGCAIAAGTGMACGLVLLRGGSTKTMAHTINNLASSITGMICDGGNQGCTMKGIVAVDAAWQAVSLAEKQAYIYNVHGINGATPEQTMRNMGLIASPGMVGTEKTIVEILQDKQAKE